MGSPPADIFVWGLHPQTTPDDIVKDLADSNIHIDQKDVMKKSKDGAALLSFKVSVCAEDLQKALDPAIWPLRVKVRECISYTKKKDTNQSSMPNHTRESQIPGISVNEESISSGVAVSNRFNALADDRTNNQ